MATMTSVATVDKEALRPNTGQDRPTVVMKTSKVKGHIKDDSISWERHKGNNIKHSTEVDNNTKASKLESNLKQRQ